MKSLFVILMSVAFSFSVAVPAAIAYAPAATEAFGGGGEKGGDKKKDCCKGKTEKECCKSKAEGEKKEGCGSSSTSGATGQKGGCCGKKTTETPK